MTDKIKNRVGEAITGTGTADTSTPISLNGALTGLQTLAVGYSTGGSGSVTEIPVVLSTGDNWQVGIGTFTDNSPDTFQFSRIDDSSDSGAAIDYDATSEIRVTLTALFLEDAKFPTFASFDAEIDNSGVDPAVDFSTGNKQTASNAASGAITVAAPGVGTYRLKIPSSDGFSSIAGTSGTTTWVGDVPVGVANKLLVVGCDFDGTNWTLCGSIEQ